ncbi:hypothetical protein QBC44DRAFT_311688 [Cladorrhinum sp. PSN332]|nr:hypothetical protein QBC44DRAFT_311688 [Cladorrhinum sp. PSN332]
MESKRSIGLAEMRSLSQTSREAHKLQPHFSSNQSLLGPCLVLTTDDGKIQSLQGPREADGSYLKAEKERRQFYKDLEDALKGDWDEAREETTEEERIFQLRQASSTDHLVQTVEFSTQRAHRPSKTSMHLKGQSVESNEGSLSSNHQGWHGDKRNNPERTKGCHKAGHANSRGDNKLLSTSPSAVISSRGPNSAQKPKGRKLKLQTAAFNPRYSRGTTNPMPSRIPIRTRKPEATRASESKPRGICQAKGTAVRRVPNESRKIGPNPHDSKNKSLRHSVPLERMTNLRTPGTRPF